MVKGVPVMAAPGEIDASNADWLRTTLLETAARGHATFVVDMTRTRLCASAGLGALVQAHKRALAEGAELRLLMPTSAAVLRVFALTGSGQPGELGRCQQLGAAGQSEGTPQGWPDVRGASPDHGTDPAAAQAEPLPELSQMCDAP